MEIAIILVTFVQEPDLTNKELLLLLIGLSCMTIILLMVKTLTNDSSDQLIVGQDLQRNNWQGLVEFTAREQQGHLQHLIFICGTTQTSLGQHINYTLGWVHKIRCKEMQCKGT